MAHTNIARALAPQPGLSPSLSQHQGWASSYRFSHASRPSHSPARWQREGALVPFPFPREGNAGTYISTMLYNVVARKSTHSALRVAGVAPFPLGALCRWMQVCVLRGFACLLAFSSGGISGPWRQCGWILRTGSAVHDGRGKKSLRFYLSSRSFESWQGSWLVA